MKSFLLPSFFIVMLASSATGNAAECWQREASDKIPVPAGNTLTPGGYVCIDHRGTYAEIISGNGPHELVIPHRGFPRSDSVLTRIVPRNALRVVDLKTAGLLREPQVDQRLAKR